MLDFRQRFAPTLGDRRWQNLTRKRFQPSLAQVAIEVSITFVSNRDPVHSVLQHMLDSLARLHARVLVLLPGVNLLQDMIVRSHSDTLARSSPSIGIQFTAEFA